LSWDRVHAEAEVREQALSPELEAVIDTKLGHRVGTRTATPFQPGTGGRTADLLPVRIAGVRRDLTAATTAAFWVHESWTALSSYSSATPLATRPAEPETIPEESDGMTVKADTVTSVPVSPSALGGAAPAATEAGSGGPSVLDVLLAKGRIRAGLSMLGPAFVASIAYVDPGNFATNFQGGAQFGYLLLWVVLAANVIAMLVQYLSAKLGIATDLNLPENFRAHYPRALTWGMWVQAEIMAMSTDIAEFLGAAIGLNPMPRSLV